MNKFALAFAVTAVSAAALPSQAHAVVTTIATSTPATQARTFVFVNSGNSAARTTNATFFTAANGTSTTPSAVIAKFSFLDPLLVPSVTNVSALFTLSGTIAKNVNAVLVPLSGGTLVQPGLTGSFSFISTTAITVSGPHLITHTYAAGSNLLSATFSGAAIAGSGSTAGLNDSTNSGGFVSYTSDFLDFSHVVNEGSTFSLSSIVPSLGIHVGANGALKSFRATANGQYSTDPAPLVNNLAVVPEPATWAMMIAGFGMIGCSLRMRRKAVPSIA